MDKWWKHLFLLSVIALCHSQSSISLTEPKLTSITAVNSSALSVTWQFANSTYDQSDLIRVYIDFYEFYYNNYSKNISVNYIFTPTNKTITNRIQTFDLVNAYYYICFSSNSTYSNLTTFLFVKTCQLKRTCLRSNSSICPQDIFVLISPTTITSNSFIITIYWLKNLPYSRGSTNVQLTNGVQGTALSSIENTTYISLPYQFSSLQSQTSYTVNITVNYIIFDKSMTDVMTYTVTTSRSSNLFYTGDILIFTAWSVLLSFLFY